MLDKSQTSINNGMDLMGSALEAVSDGILVIDNKGKVLFLNRAAEQMTGYRSFEATGKPLQLILKFQDKRTGEKVADPARSLLQSQAKMNDKRAHLIMTSRDGTQRAIVDGGSKIRKKNDSVQGAVLIFRDASENVRQEEQEIKTQHLESLGNLAGGIAHDFNNVLTAILGNLSLARMAKNDEAKLWNRLDHAENAALRARDLSRQLLTFAKGGAPIRQPSDLEPLIHDATTLALHESKAHCKFEIEDHLWPVDVDHGQFSQAVRNLVAFAGDSMPEGGNVEVSAANISLTRNAVKGIAAGKYVLISIKDHGNGMPPKELKRIFEPYYATRKTGCGLGLATAHSIIQRHQGHIRVESLLENGTSFNIYLPCSRSQPEKPVETFEDLVHHGNGRILVMDDESEVRLVASDMLELMGYEVETSPDGFHAIQLYKTAQRIGKPFSAVIFDLTIPTGMGGREAVTKLREFDLNAKVIVSSGYSYDPVMANFREFGFDGVVPKPYKPEELSRTLNAVLNRKDRRHLAHY